MKRLSQHLRSNIVAYLALFVALGGTSYAAFSLPAGSVGARQLRDGSVAPMKLDASRTGAFVRAWAVITGNGTVLRAHPRAHTDHFGGGGGSVSWGLRPRAGCFELATLNGNNEGGYASVIGGAQKLSVTTVASDGRPAPETVAVALLCTP
ncbi:MAG: hypothetical protein ACR2LV_07395 [Solirubrobacteraceae bacterium]